MRLISRPASLRASCDAPGYPSTMWLKTSYLRSGSHGLVDIANVNGAKFGVGRFRFGPTFQAGIWAVVAAPPQGKGRTLKARPFSLSIVYKLIVPDWTKLKCTSAKDSYPVWIED